jgi:hypothetical protein
MCTPIAYFWDKSIPGGYCLNAEMVWMFNASFNILLDFVIFLLPMRKVSELQMPKKQKIALMMVFALGLL